MQQKDRISVFDRSGSEVTVVAADAVRAAGALFLGTGASRRTFAWHSPDRSYREVTTGQLQPRGAVSWRTDAVACDLPAGVRVDTFDREAAEADAFHVTLRPGQCMVVDLHEADGAFMVSFDRKGDQRLVVHADLEGSEAGDEGVIYLEDYGQTPDELAQAQAIRVQESPREGAEVETKAERYEAAARTIEEFVADARDLAEEHQQEALSVRRWLDAEAKRHRDAQAPGGERSRSSMEAAAKPSLSSKQPRTMTKAPCPSQQPGWAWPLDAGEEAGASMARVPSRSPR